VYRKEVGSDFIDRVVSEPGSHRFISRFTILEMESVLALKFRTGEIDEQSLLISLRRLEADLGKRRLLVATVNDAHLRDGRRLLTSHARTEALRAPDALQLAVALGLRRAGLVSVFVAADKKLCRVAAIEGITTINPELPLTL
jgi:predicted nucleic acid-binding protein